MQRTPKPVGRHPSFEGAVGHLATASNLTTGTRSSGTEKFFEKLFEKFFEKF